MPLKLNNLLCLCVSKMISSFIFLLKTKDDKMFSEFKISTLWINLQNGAKKLQLTTVLSFFTALHNKIEIGISCESSTDRHFM